MSDIVATAIQRHMRDIIVKNTNVAPKTPLVSADSDSLVVAVTPLIDSLTGQSRFQEMGWLGFYDNLGDPQATISSVSEDGATLTLAPSSGTGFPTLAHVHTPETTPFVYTNIFDFRPPTTAQAGLALGDPVVIIDVTSGTMPQGPWMASIIEPYYVAQIQVHRPLGMPEDSRFTWDPASWVRFTMNATKDDIDLIVGALTRQQSLVTDFEVGISEQFAPLNKSGDIARITYAEEPAFDGGGVHYVAIAQIVIAATAIKGDF